MCSSAYLKALLRYKFLILDVCHQDSLYLLKQGWEDPLLSFVANRGSREKKSLGNNALHITPDCRELKIVVRTVRNVFCCLKKKGHLTPRTEFYGTQGQSPLNPNIRDYPKRSVTNMIPLRCLPLFPSLIWLYVAPASASYSSSLANSASVWTSRHHWYFSLCMGGCLACCSRPDSHPYRVKNTSVA